MFSFGIEPSMTRTKGRSSSSRAAWRKGSRNSSPPSVGESTLLCRWTLGSPGIAPSSTSSMPGCPAAVTETESPSQLIPSEIHRMWTSSTPWGVSLTAMARPSCACQCLFEVDRLDQQLLALHDLHVEPAARRARQRERVRLGLGRACGAAHHRGLRFDDQLGALKRG